MVMEVLYLYYLYKGYWFYIRHSNFGLTLCFGQEEWDNQHALDLLMLNLDLIRNSLSNNPPGLGFIALEQQFIIKIILLTNTDHGKMLKIK
jgi:hypothetical protein